MRVGRATFYKWKKYAKGLHMINWQSVGRVAETPVIGPYILYLDIAEVKLHLSFGVIECTNRMEGPTDLCQLCDAHQKPQKADQL
jgi:hypothetical protein